MVCDERTQMVSEKINMGCERIGTNVVDGLF